jgi:hypothetical protein
LRKPLILLAVIALVIIVAGAVNRSVAFDADYVVGTATAVSLLWVSVLIAALVFVAGAAAAWLALAATTGTRRKLEAELQSTYERLREAEALAARRARPATEEPRPAVVAEPQAAEPERAEPPAVEPEMVEPEATDESATTIQDEAQTTIRDEAVTVVAGDEPVADERPPADAPSAAGDDPGQTAVTTVPGASAEPDTAGDEPTV